MLKTRWISPILALWLASSLGAATVRTRDGRTLSGAVRFEGGRLTVQSPQGACVSIEPADIVEADLTTPDAIPSASPSVAPNAVIGGGLKGEYFSHGFSDPRFVRTDPCIDFDFPKYHPIATEDAWAVKDLAIRWTGEIRARFSERYALSVLPGRHVRLWLDGRRIVGDGTFAGEADLEAGKKYPIRIEYVADEGGPIMKLTWESASEPKAIVPPECLFVTPNDPDAPPTVRLSSPNPGSMRIGPTNVLLSSEVRPGGSAIKAVEFRSDQTVVFTATKPPYAYTWTAVPPGAYQITAKVIDEKGHAMLTLPVPLMVGGNAGGAIHQPWGELNVAKPNEAERALNHGDTFTVQHKGGELFAQRDDFHLVAQPLSGDGVLVARLTGLRADNKEARPLAGLMIRSSARPDSPHASVCFFPAMGAVFISRQNAEGEAATFSSSGRMPVFFRLVREGSAFRGYRSDDGEKWEFLGEQTIDMPPDALAGLAVSSGTDAALATATFDRVALTRSNTPHQSLAMSADKAIVLTDGTRLPGQLKFFQGQPALQRRSGPWTINADRIARVLYKPVRDQTFADLYPDQTGAILDNGDFFEGEVTILPDGAFSVSSVVFGPRAFHPTDLAAVVLRRVDPPSGYEIQSSDGAVFHTAVLTIDTDGMHVSTLAGPITIAPKDVTKIVTWMARP